MQFLAIFTTNKDYINFVFIINNIPEKDKSLSFSRYIKNNQKKINIIL
jgi:hypothetical protein